MTRTDRDVSNPLLDPPTRSDHEHPGDDFEPIRTAGECLDCAHNHLRAANLNFQQAQECDDLIDRDGVTTLLSATSTLCHGASHLAEHQQRHKA